MSKAVERESVSDRLALYKFYVVAGMSVLAEAAFVAAFLLSLFFPNLPNRIDSATLLLGITGVLNLWTNPPENKKKEGGEAQAIALPGSVVSQTVEAESNDST
jgi:hypothetical protein